MTRPISLKSTRLEILLEVTEDRGIESGKWDLLQQTILSSVEGVDADLMKRTGVMIEEFFFFFHMFSACLREVLGHNIPREGAKEGYMESVKNLDRGLRTNPQRQQSMEISSIHGLLTCLGPHHFHFTQSTSISHNKYHELN